MATYEWICRDCNLWWDRHYDVGKAPSRTKCPECKKLSNRYWQNANVAVSFKDDGKGNQGSGANDFHTVRRRYEKHAKEGFDQDSANRFLHRSIKETGERIADDNQRYKPVYLRPDRLVEKGEAKKLSQKERSEKIERARKLTIDTYDKAKIDPTEKRPKQY